MGNKAVITTVRDNVSRSNGIGVYLHWNGGRDSVRAFLAYCKLRGFRSPEKDDYGWARLCQIVGNYFGGSLSIGINKCCNLDCDNGDNGVYVIENWEIVGRKYFKGGEQDEHDLGIMLHEINTAQPEVDRLEGSVIDDYVNRADCC